MTRGAARRSLEEGGRVAQRVRQCLFEPEERGFRVSRCTEPAAQAGIQGNWHLGYRV